MIVQSQFTWAIILMAMITFAVRYAFFMRMLRFNLHPKIKSLLTFTAPCVLTALFVPIMFQDVIILTKEETASFTLISSLQSMVQSSYFWASIVAGVLSLYLRNTLLVIILSMATFYVLRMFL